MKNLFILLCFNLFLCTESIGQTNPNNLDSERQILPNSFQNSFGDAVAIYKDKHAAVSAPFENRVYLFTEDSLTFPYQVRHTFYPDSFSGLFGWDIALSDRFLVIGDWFDDELYANAGAVHIYEKRSDGGWYFLQKILPKSSDSVLYFGNTVEIQGNNLAIVNAQSNSFSKPGGLHMYEYNGNTFTMVDTIFGHISGLSTPVDIDSNRVVIGDPFDSSINSQNGKVIVYENNGRWNFSTYLFPSVPSSNLNFGESVTITGDEIIVGTPSEMKAQVYRNIGGSWANVQEIIPSNSDNNFGIDMDMSGDSLYISATFRGYLFTKNGGTWQEAWNTTDIGGKLSYKGNGYSISEDLIVNRRLSIYQTWEVSEGDDFYCDDFDGCNFGDGVAITDNYAIVGSESYTWFYEKVDTGWRQNTMFRGIGERVDIEDNQGFFRYAADDILVAEKKGVSWKIIQTIPPPPNSERFGEAISADKDALLVGAWSSDIVASNAGSAYMYRYSNGKYSLEQELLPPPTAVFYGSSVDVDNNQAVIGSYFENNGRGTAYVYSKPNVNWNLDTVLTAPDAMDFDFFGTSVAIHDSFAVIGANGVDYPPRNSAGSTYIFKKTNDWGFYQEIENSDPATNDHCGRDVSLSYNNLIISCTGKIQGIYLYKNQSGTFTINDSFPSINDNFQDVDIENENFIIGNIDYATTNQTTTDCYGHLLLDFLIPADTYEAENRITAEGFILPGSTILSAQKEIIFNHPFETGANVELSTSNDGCQ